METMIEEKIDFKSDSQPNNPHDRFARKTVGNPLFAPDFLKCYTDSFVAEYVNLE
ncbi:MAG: hypothetical protein LBQ50_06875 [Planctomycetaceae bacterium]|jgi:hypothetical protein|nr:hypothetical protein [Planctomycetaceae bacterium]